MRNVGVERKRCSGREVPARLATTLRQAHKTRRKSYAAWVRSNSVAEDELCIWCIPAASLGHPEGNGQQKQLRQAGATSATLGDRVLSGPYTPHTAVTVTVTVNVFRFPVRDQPQRCGARYRTGGLLIRMLVTGECATSLVEAAL